MAGEPPIIVVLGPTASGKSAAALELARCTGGEILSVDSMQVYRHMDVGTAKPTPAERARVRHHVIDVVDPDREFTVARFVELADATIADARRRHVPLIATGGTPLYYKSLFEGLFDAPGADASIRARLNDEPLEQLHARLSQVDAAAAARIHANDRKRLVRALEVFELTGRPISSMQSEWSGGSAHRHAARWYGLTWDKDELNRRINARVRQMMEAGWLDETRALLDRFGSLSRTASEATGYAELFEHLRGNATLDDAVERIKIATRQLARRQMKWFRRFRDVHWLPGDQPPTALADQIAGHIA
jgi:tRNA dimethylallyltransferase